MKYRITFYADSDKYTNKLFCFDKRTKQEINDLIQRFHKAGNKFRAVFFIDLETGEQKELSKSSIDNLNALYETIKQEKEFNRLLATKKLPPLPDITH